jgi:hypothetical protein
MITVPIASFIPLAGCERKEKIIEVNTPGKEIKVERDRDTGRVEVEVRDK